MITCIYYHDGWESEKGVQCTNIVIAGSKLHYGFELCIQSLFIAGSVFSVRFVRTVSAYQVQR